MNRREFLLAIGATACGGTPRRPRRARRRTKGPPMKMRPIHDWDEWTGASWLQTFPSPLAFHRDLLVQSTDDELWFWDSMTMTRIGTSSTAHESFCFLQDGTLVAFVDPPDSRACQLHRIDAKRTIDVLQGPSFAAYGAQVLPAGSPTEVYVTDSWEQVVLFRLTKHTIEESTRIHFEPYGERIQRLASFGDGRLIAKYRGDLQVIEPGKPARSYAPPGKIIIHFAPAADGRLWYTQSSKAPAQVLVLARVADRLIGDALIDFAPGRVIHLAAGGGAAAVLVFTIREAEQVYLWTVVVIDDNGQERWRSDVPAEFVDGFNLNQAFVAISEHRVVLRGSKHALLAWDAATGKRVG